MKFLVDRCAGRRLAEWLRAQDHDVLESRALGADPGDEALLALAVRERRVLATMDKEFGDLVFAQGAAHAGMIRLPDVPVARRILLISQVLADLSQTDLEQSIVTIGANRIRVSRPPERSG